MLVLLMLLTLLLRRPYTSNSMCHTSTTYLTNTTSKEEVGGVFFRSAEDQFHQHVLHASLRFRVQAVQPFPNNQSAMTFPRYDFSVLLATASSQSVEPPPVIL